MGTTASGKGSKQYSCIWAGCKKSFKTIGAATRHQDKCKYKGGKSKKYVKRPKDDE
jgi:hypothetical protein